MCGSISENPNHGPDLHVRQRHYRFNAIKDNANGFFSNLMSAMRGAFTQLTGAPLDTLKNALYTWLTSGGPSWMSSIQFNSTTDKLTFLLQYAGLTWDNVQQVVLQRAKNLLEQADKKK